MASRRLRGIPSRSLGRTYTYALLYNSSNTRLCWNPVKITSFPASALTGGAKKTALTALAALPLLLLLPLAPIGPWPTVLLGALLYFGVVYGALLLMGDPILQMGLERARGLVGRKQI